MRRRCNRLWCWSEDLRSNDIEQSRLAQRLARLGGEEVVTPGNEVIQIRHNRGFHIRDVAHVGEHKGVEWIVAPALDLSVRGGNALVDGLEQVVDLLLNDLSTSEIVQRLGNPEALRHGVAALPRRIKNVLEPLLGFLELLVLAKQLSHIERDMIEKLPVVDREGGTGAKVEELAILVGCGWRYCGPARGSSRGRSLHSA